MYESLDSVQYKPDYMCLVIDKEKDYYRAAKGFSINGVRYKRLLGTNGGIKNSIIVFVSERLYPELSRRIENGRDPQMPIVTAKLEAYKALTCSASIPVSNPKGLLVIDDAETTFFDDVVYLTDETDGEPIVEERPHEKITMDASDGYGLMLPSLAKRWSEDLGLDYLVPGVNTRFSFEKGMIFTFDFLEFAEQVAGTYFVKDAWGNTVDLRDVDLIMTTSMVKLYDSYGSCAEYLEKSYDNGYTFAVTKTCPDALESERRLNYQFIQSYDLDERDIDELIAPTVEEIRGVLGGDWRKAVLFAKGIGLTEKIVRASPADYVKAMMIDPAMTRDPFVQSCILQLIRNRINEAKVGVLKVHGNYSIVSGDPYLLCQSMFGMELTGLLRAGEIYNQYWAEQPAERLVCFRAPMTTHENIRAVRPVRRDDARYWYQYMRTVTVFNSFDTATAALNGCDFDGDLVFLTDNDVLVRRHVPMPTLMCVQRRAQKRVSTEEDFIRSNIESFGNEIGEITNWITSMFEVRAGFPKESEEYKTLSYRIRCGQLYQQNAIDKAKGIVAKPMPKYWHDRHAANKLEDEELRAKNRAIAAYRKPYFMRYIYPALKRQFSTYEKNTTRNALREFQMTVDELRSTPFADLSEQQVDFLRYYQYRMPVGTNDCVMNIICRKIEDAFSSANIAALRGDDFDYTTLKSGTAYTVRQYYAAQKLLNDYNDRVAEFSATAGTERVDKAESSAALTALNDEFRKACDLICSDRFALCDLLLDLCYRKNRTKRFVWSICGEEIIQNLLSANEGRIRWPELCGDAEPDVRYGGMGFCVKSAVIDKEDL